MVRNFERADRRSGEQTGGQAGRGCVEHIVTLRLLMQIARNKKFKLFITFVDFSKAYDRVKRNVLFSILQGLGCGIVMLSAIVAVYKVTNRLMGTSLITGSIGLRQGAPSSCILFILYINDMIRLMKDRCEVDGFLQWIHVLVLMDDTVLLSTSRAGMIKKIQLLNEYCVSHGMEVNVRKTKFMVVNGTEADREQMIVDGVMVEHCNCYI